MELKREKELRPASGHMRVRDALSHPKVLILAAAYFFVVTGNYGVELFLPSILDSWYGLKMDRLTWLLILPPIGLAGGSIVRRLELGPDGRAAVARGRADLAWGRWRLLVLVVVKAPPVWMAVGLFILAMTGLKAYLPAFWSLPTLFLAESAAAGSIGLINSVGNLGGFLGPSVLGLVKGRDRLVSRGIVVPLGLDGHRGDDHPDARPRPEARQASHDGRPARRSPGRADLKRWDGPFSACSCSPRSSWG